MEGGGEVMNFPRFILRLSFVVNIFWIAIWFFIGREQNTDVTVFIVPIAIWWACVWALLGLNSKD